MKALWFTIKKEWTLLIRDRGGLALLFLMPIALITIMALIQDAPFREYQDRTIPLGLVDKDGKDLGKAVVNGLESSGVFKVEDSLNGSTLSEKGLQKGLRDGVWKVGVVVPEKATIRTYKYYRKALARKDTTKKGLPDDPIEVEVHFDPVTKPSFQLSVRSLLERSVNEMTSMAALDILGKEISKKSPFAKRMDFSAFKHKVVQISGKELESEGTGKGLLGGLNSVQHNVPAWTLFGMFFIVVPLAGSLIKERAQGSFFRILTMPVSSAVFLSGKFIAYWVVNVVQCWAMFLVGVFLLPELGLPSLRMGDSMFALTLTVLVNAAAACSFGVLVGSVFNSQQQAATFGSVSVVILAALGGIWVPTYIMPEILRNVASFSPLNWGLEAFHTVFLRSGSVIGVMNELSLSLLFFFLTMGGSVMIFKKHSRIL